MLLSSLHLEASNSAYYSLGAGVALAVAGHLALHILLSSARSNSRDAIHNAGKSHN